MDVYAKIEKYDRTLSAPAWVTVLYIPSHWIVDVECSFLAYRSEKSCRLLVKDIGDQDTEDTANTANVAELVSSGAGAMMRLSIYSEDGDATATSFPSGWYDQSIFWSGLIDSVSADDAHQNQTCEVTAVGFAEYLKHIVDYSDDPTGFQATQTILQVVSSAYLNYILGQWPANPGNIVSATTTLDGTLGNVVGTDLGQNGFNVQEIFQTLAGMGNYFFSVRCSGYPASDSSEFTVIFLESPTVVSAAVNSRDTWTTYHLGDTNVTAFSLRKDHIDYSTRWYCTGPKPSWEFLAILTGFYGTVLSTAIQSGVIAADDIASGYIPELFRENSLNPSAGWNGVGISDVRLAETTEGAGPGSSSETRTAGYLGEETTFAATYDVARSTGTAYTADPMLIETVAYGPDSAWPDRTNFSLQDPPAAWFANGANATAFFNYADEGNDTSAFVMRFASGDRRFSIEVEEQSEQRSLRSKRLSDDALDSEVDCVLAATRDLWNERMQSESASLTVYGQVRLPIGRLETMVGVIAGEDKATVMDASSAGGFEKNSSLRPVGGSKLYTSQVVRAAAAETGWIYTYELGAAPVELSQAILSTSDKAVI